MSPLVAKATRSPDLRGVAGARLYAALISAASACGKPRRGLEVFEEMLESEEASSAAAAAATDSVGGGERSTGAAAQASLGDGVEWSEDIRGHGVNSPGFDDEEGVVVAAGEALLRGGGGRRLPPPDTATFLAALDACAAVGGEESVSLAVGVTKQAAAAAREVQERVGTIGGGGVAKARLSTRQLAAVLSKAAEVCAAAGKESTAEALAAKAAQLSADGGGSGF